MRRRKEVKIVEKAVCLKAHTLFDTEYSALLNYLDALSSYRGTSDVVRYAIIRLVPVQLAKLSPGTGKSASHTVIRDSSAMILNVESALSSSFTSRS